MTPLIDDVALAEILGVRMKGLDPGDEGRGADDKARGHYLHDAFLRPRKSA